MNKKLYNIAAVLLIVVPICCGLLAVGAAIVHTTPPIPALVKVPTLVTKPVVVNTPVPAGTQPPKPAPVPSQVSILLDDFMPQPYQGESVYFFNRLEGDRGAINNSSMHWGNGQVTTTVSSGNSWGGVWMSLNHPIREGLSIDFSAMLPAQILPAFQSQITGIKVLIARGTPNKTFKLELKNGNKLSWKNEIVLGGGQQVASFDLPALGNITQLVWVLDHASAGDYVVLKSISFTATTRITDTATAAFVWSYGMLLDNWNPTTGLVRDKAKDASGEFDAIQATGSLAAATAMAEQLGIITRANAIQIVNQISHTLLLDIPRFHGLWPHWVKVSPPSGMTIVQNTEWSSVDTVIAAVGLLDAQSGLGMDTSGTEQMLRAIDWKALVTPGGISHGYTYAGDPIPYAWDVFGGESWLVELAYAGVTGQVAPMTYPSPPAANGSGFIDELAWLFVSPPSQQDYWGTDWAVHRSAAANNQLRYYPTNYPNSCFTRLGLFGLSAAEVPAPSKVTKENIYQAFGMGGRFGAVTDGSVLLGAPVVVPHYSAMVASLHPEKTIEMWDWLIKGGYFSPLNNVESLEYPANSSCDSDSMVWNQLKGSWNLSLQTLGWGRYLAERDGRIPILWQATTANPLLRKGYLVLAGGPTPIAVYFAQPSETPVTPTWDHAQVSCDEKPFNMWGSPGTYLYKRDSGAFLSITLKSGEASPNFGVSGPSTLLVAGTETVTTSLGTFQATLLSAAREYSILTGRLDSIKGTYQRSEWYVCGYGLIKLTSSDAGIKTPGNYSYSTREDLVLLSFTPFATNESHVRYILADIQLGNVADEYRADTTDEETAEALRRWDAGIRVVNIERFERRIVNGRWQIVYADTGNPVIGMDVILNSDSQK
jgi:hypothetical protein